MPSKEAFAAWADTYGVVHYVGTHVSSQMGREIYADCGFFIGRTKETTGFYMGNTTANACCIYCLGKSRFGELAARRTVSP